MIFYGAGTYVPIKTPLVSVVVPAYNAAEFVAATLDSILAQTFQDHEIIVVNDGSPDTEELERVLEPYRRKIVYLTQENRGLAGARNTGIRAARGEFVAPLDADDIWEPDHLEAQLSVFRAEPSWDMVYADANVFGDVPEAGARLMELSPSHGEVTFESLVTRECVVQVCVCLIRRETLLKAGLFDETLRRTEDIDMWLRMALHGGRITYQKRVLGRYRRREGSLSHDIEAMIESYIGVLSKMARHPMLNSSQREVVERQIRTEAAYLESEKGKHAFLRSDTKAAIEHFSRANLERKSLRLGSIVFLLRFAPGLAKLLYEQRRARGSPMPKRGAEPES